MHSLLHCIIYWGTGLCQMVKQKIFLILDIKICGAFLVQFFLLFSYNFEGQKDTLAQVYFYWGAMAPLGSTALKFRQLVPLLTNKDVSLITRGRLYSSCVQSIMLHGSETWPVRKENVVALQRAEMRMVRC